ncbi:uncharacterized protein LOC129701039 [Leucoraja erinacea]|uniref:uncharacterized protein LOC129701039 n=1 Tax=Leucoraja erinaceus TaxID=7782 RepID=UPI00245507D8|nr:uncharacterized protein LOC129701039 [Leucoraja erinacea]
MAGLDATWLQGWVGPGSRHLGKVGPGSRHLGKVARAAAILGRSCGRPMAGEAGVSLPGAGASAHAHALRETSVKENKGFSQGLEEMHITSVCHKNGRPTWRPRVDSQHLERQITSLSWAKDENEQEDDDEADNHEYSDSDLSDYYISSSPETTQVAGMGVELFYEKEDWEKEVNEACPYDEDDLEVITKNRGCEVPLFWQDGETYNPSHDHVPSSSRAKIVEIPIVQGQFEDADE